MKCWRCEYPLEYGGDGLPQADPVEGDAALCWQCGQVGIFRRVAGQLEVCPPTPREVEELSTDLAFVEQAAAFELRRRAARGEAQ